MSIKQQMVLAKVGEKFRPEDMKEDVRVLWLKFIADVRSLVPEHTHFSWRYDELWDRIGLTFKFPVNNISHSHETFCIEFSISPRMMLECFLKGDKHEIESFTENVAHRVALKCFDFAFENKLKIVFSR